MIYIEYEIISRGPDYTEYEIFEPMGNSKKIIITEQDCREMRRSILDCLEALTLDFLQNELKKELEHITLVQR